MPAKAKSRGGLSSYQRQVMEKVQLPQRIKCNVCERNLMVAKFSNKQIEDYRFNISKSSVNKAARPRCEACTGSRGTEMECSYCDIVKALDSFSLAQRKNPDNAKCWDCQQEIEDELPNKEDALEEMRIKEELINGSISSSAISTAASLSSYTNSGSHGGSSFSGSTKGHQDAGDGNVWVPQGGGKGINYLQSQENSFRGSGQRSRSRSSSPTSSIVSSALSSEISNTTSIENTAWAHFGQEHQPYRKNLGSKTVSAKSGPPQGSNAGFAKTGPKTPQLNVGERANIRHAREKKLKEEQEAQQTLANDSDDDSDDSEVEL